MFIEKDKGLAIPTYVLGLTLFTSPGVIVSLSVLFICLLVIIVVLCCIHRRRPFKAAEFINRSFGLTSSSHNSSLSKPNGQSVQVIKETSVKALHWTFCRCLLKFLINNFFFEKVLLLKELKLILEYIG